jgi:hypothetical protein
MHSKQAMADQGNQAASFKGWQTSLQEWHAVADSTALCEKGWIHDVIAAGFNRVHQRQRCSRNDVCCMASTY